MTDALMLTQQLNFFGEALVSEARAVFDKLAGLDEETRIQIINALRLELHRRSPLASEPVDCVLWVPATSVQSNQWNPNTVAPPEMRLLEHSIGVDGYTQPIVVFPTNGHYEVVDGFHRNRVGKECDGIRKRVKGHLPVTVINSDREDKGDRMAATIRHNRARGKHRVEGMSDIVVELKRRNWTDEKIGRELGMDPDEVLRLTQITGLAELFSSREFSQAWEVDRADSATVGEEIISDIVEDDGNTKIWGGKERILHTWDKWECYRHGFYAEAPPDGISQEQGEEMYREFLADLDRFESALKIVASEWTYSCEHYLSNERMNRIAWLGQAAVAQALGLPSCCRSGYRRLTEAQQRAADLLALRYLNQWLRERGRAELELGEAGSKTAMELY